MANIITIAEYHIYDNLPSPTANDDQISAHIVLTTADIEEKTGRVFELAGSPSPIDTVEVLNGTGTFRIYTRNAPIISVSKVEYFDGIQWVEYDTDTYTYVFKANSNVVHFTDGTKFIQAYQNTRVTFQYGFASSMPDDLKLACYIYTKQGVMISDQLGLKSQSDGEQSFAYKETGGTDGRGIQRDERLMLADKIISRYKTNF